MPYLHLTSGADDIDKIECKITTNLRYMQIKSLFYRNMPAIIVVIGAFFVDING